MALRIIEYPGKDPDDRIGPRCTSKGGPEVATHLGKRTMNCVRHQDHPPNQHRCFTNVENPHDPASWTWWEWD